MGVVVNLPKCARKSAVLKELRDLALFFSRMPDQPGTLNTCRKAKRPSIPDPRAQTGIVQIHLTPPNANPFVTMAVPM